MQKHRISGIGAILAAFALASGCGLNMEQNYQKMRSNLVNHNYDAVDGHIDSVKESFYSKDNRLLYYMDKGMVLHLAKRYQESNEFLDKAAATAEELWTESISANAAALLTTDNALPYQGEDFEKVLIHFVGALNYAGLGDYEAARVEARRVSEKLELYNSKYTEEEGKNAYKDDAFARWLSGKLAETEGGYEALNNAWIDYQKALKVYADDYGRYNTPVPRMVVEDAMRVLTALGGDFARELKQVKAWFPGVQPAPVDKAMGEIVFIHMSGEAPYKVDRYWEDNSQGELLRIAYPEFVVKNHSIAKARITAASVAAETELGEDVAAIALQNLADHSTRIKAKAIARAIAKYIASKGMQAVGENNDSGAGQALQLAGALFQVANYAMEEADKRSWITLPAQVNVGRVFVPAGEVTLDVDFLDASGNVVENAQLTTTVKPGKPVFVSYRTFR